jgi:hypothetical protein
LRPLVRVRVRVQVWVKADRGKAVQVQSWGFAVSSFIRCREGFPRFAGGRTSLLSGRVNRRRFTPPLDRKRVIVVVGWSGLSFSPKKRDSVC